MKKVAARIGLSEFCGSLFLFYQLGHIVIGVGMLTERIRNIPKFPEKLERDSFIRFADPPDIELMISLEHSYLCIHIDIVQCFKSSDSR